MQFSLEKYMQEAIECARQSGTSYGAAVVDLSNGEKIVVANSVREQNDPTAHAEVNAIRQAAAQGMDLKQCVLISTCEPCPMCAMASVWAGIPKICYGATINDAARYGHQVKIYCREITSAAWYDIEVEEHVLREKCMALFEI